MNQLLRQNQKLISDVDIHYGPGTRPQVPLPFSIWVRRKYWWWPGSERYSGLIDRLIIVALIIPGVIWAFVSFGWITMLFIIAEAVIICEIFYRIATGTILGK
jgi:hypothetical protein